MSRAFRYDSLDTPQAYILRKKFPHKIGPWKFRANGHFGPKRSLLGPLGPQKGPDTRTKCVVTMSPAQTGQSGAVGTKSGPPEPSEDLRGPHKGHFGPKRSLLGPLGARYQVKVCCEYESNPDWPIGGRWDQIWCPGALRGPPRSPKGPFMDKTGPFRLFLIVFSSWVVLWF